MRASAASVRSCLLIFAGLGLVIAITGCTRQRPPHDGHSSCSGWIPDLVQAPEHDSNSYEFLCWEEGLKLAIMDDFFGSGKSRGNFYYNTGVREDLHGARYEWRLDTTDGKTATFRINDKEYDLSAGAIFIINGNGDKIEIHQLSRDLSAVTCENGAISHFLTNDAEVRKLFGKVDAPNDK